MLSMLSAKPRRKPRRGSDRFALERDDYSFFRVAPERIVAKSPLTRRDGFLVSTGHTLVVPPRNFARLSEASLEEIWQALREAAHQPASERRSDGFNVGLNVGRAAGMTTYPAARTASTCSVRCESGRHALRIPVRAPHTAGRARTVGRANQEPLVPEPPHHQLA